MFRSAPWSDYYEHFNIEKQSYERCLLCGIELGPDSSPSPLRHLFDHSFSLVQPKLDPPLIWYRTRVLR